MSNQESTPGVIQWETIPDVGKDWLGKIFKDIQKIRTSFKDRVYHNDFGTFRVIVGFANHPGYLFKAWINPKWNTYNVEYWALDIRAEVWHYIRVNGPPKEAE